MLHFDHHGKSLSILLYGHILQSMPQNNFSLKTPMTPWSARINTIFILGILLMYFHQVI